MNDKIQIKVYYDAQSPANSELLTKKLETLSRVSGVSIIKIERGDLSESEESRVLDQIRKIKPQARGSIVTSGGRMLPLSGSKKLNLQNTPVILVEGAGDQEPRYVFPCSIGEKYYSASDGIDFLEQNLPDLPKLEGESEEDLAKLISKNPEMLERGLRLVSEELDTPTGRCDLLFEDRNGAKLLIEVERDLSDQALGQVLRLAAGYEQESKGKIRAGIVCLHSHDNLELGAKRAGIEIWTIIDDSKGNSTARKL